MDESLSDGCNFNGFLNYSTSVLYYSTCHSVHRYRRRFTFKYIPHKIFSSIVGFLAYEAKILLLGYSLKNCSFTATILRCKCNIQTCKHAVISLLFLCSRMTFLSGLINRKSVRSTCSTMVLLWSSEFTGVFISFSSGDISFCTGSLALVVSTFASHLNTK